MEFTDRAKRKYWRETLPPPSHVVCHCEFSPLEQIILIVGFAKLNDNQNSVLFSISTGLMFSYKHISYLSRVGDTVFTLLLSALLLMDQ